MMLDFSEFQKYSTYKLHLIEPDGIILTQKTKQNKKLIEHSLSIYTKYSRNPLTINLLYWIISIFNPLKNFLRMENDLNSI